jgi:hypothetical protein
MQENAGKIRRNNGFEIKMQTIAELQEKYPHLNINGENAKVKMIAFEKNHSLFYCERFLGRVADSDIDRVLSNIDFYTGWKEIACGIFKKCDVKTSNHDHISGYLWDWIEVDFNLSFQFQNMTNIKIFLAKEEVGKFCLLGNALKSDPMTIDELKSRIKSTIDVMSRNLEMASETLKKVAASMSED